MDPVALLKGLVSLRRLTGLYPSGHPAIEQKLAELDDTLQRHIRVAAALRIDVIHGAAHIDGVPFRQDSDAQSQVLRELTDLGIDSIHFGAGVARAELLALSEFLWQLKEAPTGEPIDAQLAARQHPAHHPRPAGSARYPVEDRAVAGRADRAISIRPTSCRWRSPSGRSTT